VKGAVVGAVAALVLAGCGGHSSTSASGGTSGKGIGDGLRAAGLRLCAGPLAENGDTSSPAGAAGPVTLSLYGERGFGALVASGSAAQRHAIDLALLRNHVQTSVTASDVAATEVVCSDEVLIPLGRRASMHRFIGVLSTLVNVKFTPQQFIYFGSGHYLTVPEKVNENRPYCRKT
jgi:hypothetical protein